MKNKLFFLNCFLVLALVFCFVPSTAVSAETPSSIIIVSDSANVYVQPDKTSEVLEKAYFGENFLVIEEINGFFKIEVGQQVGFVDVALCMNSENKPLTKELDTNATITKNTAVFLKTGSTFKQIESLSLNQGERIKLLYLNPDQPYALISFTVSNQNFTYYVPSDAVNADGVPVRTVMAIMLITACVSIFLIIYGYYKSKQKALKQQI